MSDKDNFIQKGCSLLSAYQLVPNHPCSGFCIIVIAYIDKTDWYAQKLNISKKYMATIFYIEFYY